MRRIVTCVLFVLLGVIPLFVRAQTKTLHGIVKSKTTGAPLAGVTVNNNNVTDANGNFNIVVTSNSILTISYVGYETQQIVIDSAADQLVIELIPSNKSLDAIVVTALGVSRQRKSLGYATQELKSADISEAKESNLVNAFAGKVAGVRVTNTQGDMGSSRIIIRGETSISGGNEPLFIVDDIPVDNNQFGAGGSRDYRNAIADINAEDIETISVLKGPNAAALYGSRAAHGVIMIKTKTGKKKQGVGVTVNSNTTLSTLLILPEYQNVFGQGAEGKFKWVDGKSGDNDYVDESWGP